MKSALPSSIGSQSTKSKASSHASTFEQAVKPNGAPHSINNMNSTSQSIFSKDDNGESVRVAVRVRPLMPFEKSRGDAICLSVPDSTHCHIQSKYALTQRPNQKPRV